MEYIKNMSDHELGVIVKAFAECKNCSDCPCDGVLCSRQQKLEERKIFILEIAERLMERK